MSRIEFLKLQRVEREDEASVTVSVNHTQSSGRRLNVFEARFIDTGNGVLRFQWFTEGDHGLTDLDSISLSAYAVARDVLENHDRYGDYVIQTPFDHDALDDFAHEPIEDDDPEAG